MLSLRWEEMPDGGTPQRKERNRVGGTCRVASEQLKRKGQGSKAGPWKRPVLSVLPLRCAPRWGQSKGGRSSFHRSPQADTELPSSPAPQRPLGQGGCGRGSLAAPLPPLPQRPALSSAGPTLLSTLPSTPLLSSPPHLLHPLPSLTPSPATLPPSLFSSPLSSLPYLCHLLPSSTPTLFTSFPPGIPSGSLRRPSPSVHLLELSARTLAA